MPEPTVSIIIPTRNRAHLVKQAIQSALNQTYDNIEVIVIDDGSETEHLTALLQVDSPKLTILQNETNRGGPYSRNRGLQSCKGEFVIFLDDDDQIEPDKVKLQINKFEELNAPNVGVITSHAADYRSGEKQVKYNRIRGDIHSKVLKSYELHGIETMMIRKTCLEEIGGFDPKLVANQEYDLIVRLSRICEFDYVDEILSRENRSENQINLNFGRKFKAAGQIWNRHHPLWVQDGLKTVAYNYIRFLYLFSRYIIGMLFGEKVYRIVERKKS